MDGGIHALKGFIYQATVILDVVLPHFETRPAGRARPEGADDLVLEWTEPDGVHCEFIQIKKPREDDQGRLKHDPWTLPEVVHSLLSLAMDQLRGNGHVQRWILGDDLEPEVRTFLDARLDAPTLALSAYLHTVHLLARESSKVTGGLPQSSRRSLGQWRFDPVQTTAPDAAVEELVRDFSSRVTSIGASQPDVQRYAAAVDDVHRALPGLLARIHADTTFGREEEVRRRVCDRLARAYPISRQRIADTVFGNAKTFVEDVAVRRGTWFDRNALDDLIVRVWPDMMPLREPPPLPKPHVERRELIERILGSLASRAVEVVGVAGSGKTSLARGLYDHVKTSSLDVDVVYAEVRRDRTLREVLAGLAFHLSPRGTSAPRDAAELSGITEEERAQRVAQALATAPGKTLLLVDLVQGDCDDEFARLLAVFLSAAPAERCTLVIFGQTSALRAMTQIERESAGIPPRIEQSGFHFEEFLALVGQVHEGLDRQRLWSIHERATAGRVAGLFARLAYDLACTATIEAMEGIVAAPPDQVLPRAIRDRFERLPAAVRPAAECLACFMLPFRLAEAMDVFPHERVKAAVDALLQLGLLNHHDPERLEMHETVRRSIENDIAPHAREQVHRALALSYRASGNVLAEVHHLHCGGLRPDAHRLAREAFLSGRHGFPLLSYVAENRLVTGAELADSVLEGPLEPERGYLVPRLLRQLGDASTADRLMNGLVAQASRFEENYRWAWLVVESILACDPARLHGLALFGLAGRREPDGKPSTKRLEYITHGARRSVVRVTSELLQLFQRQDDVTKWEMLDLLLLDPRRDVLQVVLPFADAHERPAGNQRNYVARRGPQFLVPLRSTEEIVAFLGAIPLPELPAMVLSRGPALARLAELIWARREQLQPASVTLLESGHDDDTVLENALRVLLLYGERRTLEFCDLYKSRKSRLGSFAVVLPALLPQQADRNRHEAQLLDSTRDMNDRMGDLAVLSSMTGDLGGTLEALEAADPANAKVWRFMLLMQSALHPFEEAVPLLEEALGSADRQQAQLFAPCLAKLGELPGERVTAMVVRFLSHSSPRIRLVACLILQARRCRGARVPLLDMLDREDDAAVIQCALLAVLASAPVAVDGGRTFWSRSPHTTLWRCVLAGRLRAADEAGSLVAVAVGPMNNWQLRRAAILAASRLPFDAALARITDAVMQERSPFTLDGNSSLQGHQALCAVLELELDEDQLKLLQTYGPRRVWEVWIDAFTSDALFPEGAPNVGVAAQWAADRLFRHGRPPTDAELQHLVDELHVPVLHAAVLRGLRLAGQYDRIAQIGRGADTEWLLMRSCCECLKGRTVTEEIIEQVRALIAASFFAASPFAANILINARKWAAGPVAIPQGVAAPPPPVVTASDVVAALEAGRVDVQPPFVLHCEGEPELMMLAERLDPANDYTTTSVAVEPNLSFVAGGVSVGGIQSQQRDNRAQLRATLRPVVAAANGLRVPIPWHTRLLSERQYLSSFVRQLGTQGDPERFYEELAVHGELIVPLLDDSVHLSSLLPLIDERIVPFLARYADVGTDGLLETLCSMAGRVIDAVIDPVLALLFRRWRLRFDTMTKRAQHDGNVPLWRAFGSLSRHPRFRMIRDYDLRLIELLPVTLPWFHKKDIVRCLLDTPRSYARLECLLFKSAPFEHWHEDDVDRLDDAAQALFERVLEG